MVLVLHWDMHYTQTKYELLTQGYVPYLCVRILMLHVILHTEGATPHSEVSTPTIAAKGLIETGCTYIPALKVVEQ